MKFHRPVDAQFPVLSEFGEKGIRWDQQVDPQTGFWIPRVSGYGEHHGTDFMCPEGTTVKAMADGVIVKASYESSIDIMSGSGLHIVQLVIMPGFDAWWCKYCHLKSAHVKIGQKVIRGQEIASSGLGESRRAYLHVDLMDPRHQFHSIRWEK